MRKSISLIISLMLAVSCSTDGSFEWSKSTQCTAKSYDIGTPGTEFSQQSTFTVTVRSQWESKADITISGYKFASDGETLDLLLRDVEFEIYGSTDPSDPLYGAWIFSTSEVVPYVKGVPSTKYTLSNFNGSYADKGMKFDFDIKPDEIKYHTTLEYPDSNED